MTGRVWYSLYGRLLNEGILERAFKVVKSRKGAPGIDGQSCKDFAENLHEELATLIHELRNKTYRPLPVKRVEIEKAGGGIRLLGIPAVRDRVVQHALKQVIEPIFEEDFYPGSFGYRPGRSPQKAVLHAMNLMREEDLDHIVDMDLSKFFDRLDHELLIKMVRKRITDGSILNLIRMFLESGVIKNGVLQATRTGSPQGGVISPLLANIYLNAFDWEMTRRGHKTVRYADDILILKSSRKGAENALKVATKYLEETLKLKVNEQKTHLTTLDEGVKYLGFIITRKYLKIQPDKLANLKLKLKRITRRNSPVNLNRLIREINPVLRGFMNYFRIANCKTDFKNLMGWLRRRLRAKQLKLWKKPKKLHRRLRQLGYKGEFMHIKMSSWRNSASPLAHYAMPNSWFRELRLYHPPMLEGT